VARVGLSPETFWRLTWYEWGLYILRLYEESEKRNADHEILMALNGDLMALIANVNRDPKKRVNAFSRNDFYKLTFDTQLKQEVDPELFQKVARRLGGKIKQKGSGDK
jgi:hypothetical protein